MIIYLRYELKLIEAEDVATLVLLPAF